MRVQFNVKFVSFLAPSCFCLWNSNGLIHFNLCMSQYTVRTVWSVLWTTWLVGWLVGLLVGWLVGRFIPVAPTWSIGHPWNASFQFSFLIYSVGLLRRVISPSKGRYLTQTQNKHKQTSMPRVGCEPTILAFKLAQTFHALDRAATVIGMNHFLQVDTKMRPKTNR
jgi:hypothetical protein